jgi:hypothetical protein
MALRVLLTPRRSRHFSRPRWEYNAGPAASIKKRRGPRYTRTEHFYPQQRPQQPIRIYTPAEQNQTKRMLGSVRLRPSTHSHSFLPPVVTSTIQISLSKVSEGTTTSGS